MQIPSHDAYCPADCDCRKQSAASNGSVSGGGSSASTSSGSTAAKSTASEASEPQDTAATSEPGSIEKGTGFTENSSAVTRDLLYDKHTNKQFITVETRNGHTLYLVIDYDKPLDEDGEQYETYFLNLVDESDLYEERKGQVYRYLVSAATDGGSVGLPEKPKFLEELGKDREARKPQARKKRPARRSERSRTKAKEIKKTEKAAP